MRKFSAVLVLVSMACAGHAVAQSNLGAIPAYQAIQNAKTEVENDSDASSAIWATSKIKPLKTGWCVNLQGYDRTAAKAITIPLFVEQDGRAWRTDAYGKQKYNGGADGLYMPPIIADGCHVMRDKKSK